MPQNVKFDLQTMLSSPPANPQYAQAAELNAEILNCAKTAQENLYRMAMGFKRMRDEKLYMALGYRSFGEYCEHETGLNRQNVYQYIKVVEKLPKEFVLSTRQIGKEKLYLLTTISDSEREEIVESTDLENTSVRELKQRIRELEKENSKNAESSQSRIESLQARLDDTGNAMRSAAQEAKQYKERNADLEAQIRELESRPIEVAVQEVPVTSSVTENKSDSKSEQLDEDYLTWLAAFKNAENAMHDLAAACMKYRKTESRSHALELAQKFIDGMNKIGL